MRLAFSSLVFQRNSNAVREAHVRRINTAPSPKLPLLFCPCTARLDMQELKYMPIWLELHHWHGAWGMGHGSGGVHYVIRLLQASTPRPSSFQVYMYTSELEAQLLGVSGRTQQRPAELSGKREGGGVRLTS